MKNANTNTVTKSLESLFDPMPPEQQARLARLAARPEREIDTSDIPEMTPGFMKRAKRLAEVFPKMAEALEEIRSRREAEQVQPRRTPPARVDVRAIRERLGMSQGTFAGSFGFSVHTLRHWESGRRVPEASARVLLAVIAHSPEAVFTALESPAPAAAGRLRGPVGKPGRPRKQQLPG